MSRTAWTLSGLLAVALVASYLTWQHPPQAAAAQERHQPGDRGADPACGPASTPGR